MSDSALSLFEGERNGVLIRMRILIQDRLAPKKSPFIKGLAEKTGCTFDEISTVVTHKDSQQNKPIEQDHGRLIFKVFRRIESPLNISIHDALGPSFFEGGTREYWQKQCKVENPIFFIGRTGKSTGDTTFLSQEEKDSKELDLYVRLRAIEELIEFSKQTEP